ncbi:aldo/keto reductase [Oscillibacter valericigenes]|uniref:aldo/keto reductase n=1 Tax=Oscillibacter valericigenes TaxID=351091 RepID=UPI001959AD8F|nr:aldo/keto reductase [Oscillibacter valericigenes]MBM6909410.1 aldo/keto reductase [Oscillibacter valericigenes]
MNTRTLGADLTVSAVGLGCMGFSHAYGAPTEQKEAVRAIRAAYDLGYTMFDTAETYGTAADPHENEKLVGEALKDVRNGVQIVTKFGIRFDETSAAVNKPLIPDSRPETIRASLEGSLRRLGTDHIDLYFQHRMDPNVEPEAVAQVMADLIREGKITHWGISEATEDYLRRAHKVCPVTAVQNRYSMMARQHEALFPVLEELNVGFVAFSPMANGLLTARYGKDDKFDPKLDYRSTMPQFTPEAAEENRELLQTLRNLAEEKHATPAQISLSWMLCKKPYIVPIPGSRKEERMRENAGAAEVVLSPAEVATLDRILETIPMSAVFGGTAVKSR